MRYKNDGQTKSLRFRKVILVDENNAFKSKDKKVAEGGVQTATASKTASTATPSTMRLIYQLSLAKFCLSVIGKVQEFKDN